MNGNGYAYLGFIDTPTINANGVSGSNIIHLYILPTLTNSNATATTKSNCYGIYIHNPSITVGTGTLTIDYA